MASVTPDVKVSASVFYICSIKTSLFPPFYALQCDARCLMYLYYYHLVEIKATVLYKHKLDDYRRFMFETSVFLREEMYRSISSQALFKAFSSLPVAYCLFAYRIQLNGLISSRMLGSHETLKYRNFFDALIEKIEYCQHPCTNSLPILAKIKNASAGSRGTGKGQIQK